jgi:hypothetical protein
MRFELFGQLSLAASFWSGCSRGANEYFPSLPNPTGAGYDENSAMMLNRSNGQARDLSEGPRAGPLPSHAQDFGRLMQDAARNSEFKC